MGICEQCNGHSRPKSPHCDVHKHPKIVPVGAASNQQHNASSVVIVAQELRKSPILIYAGYRNSFSVMYLWDGGLY